MRRPLAFAMAAALFALLATANSGGYRYGVSDQAFYGPAVAISLDSGLFPRDRAVLAPQMRLWAGDEILAALGRLVGGDLPILFALVYGVTMVALFSAGVALARSLGADWWAVAAFLVLLTLRHRIAKTGANSLEGYMHPRMLAFAFGLVAFAAIVRGRLAVAIAWTTAAALSHPTTAIWFGVVLSVAVAWRLSPRRALALGAAGLLALAVAAMTTDAIASRLTIMDADWIAVLSDKDYLFSAGWPVYAWMINMAYPVIVALIYRRRRSLGVTTTGESALVAGLMVLVVIFLVSVPLTERRLAMAVQLQINRVFWLIDAVVACYAAWWVMNDLGRRWSDGLRRSALAVLLAIAAARGYYVFAVEADRQLVQLRLPVTAWTDAMAWLRGQPKTWHVLADPQHAWLYGPSVRVAAERDTLLENSKDSAMAMYDRDLARRVAERSQATSGFVDFTRADVTALASRFGLDVFVDRANRHFDFPVLYRNDEFVVYNLH